MTPPAGRLLFRFEGVVSQTAESAIFSALPGSVAATDPAARRAVRDLAVAMRSGALGWAGLCAQAASILGAREDAGVLGKRALDGLLVTTGMEGLLASISGNLETWLFCEIDREVIEPTLARLGIDRRIPSKRWLFSKDVRRRFRAHAPREMIAVTARRLKTDRAALLWIDDRPSVTTELIRAGWNAVVFVDAFRLQRNLVLRGLLQ